MRINEEFILRKIAGDIVIVPTGESSQYFNGLITLNKVGAFIWEQVERCESRDEIVTKVVDTYEVDAETAKKDVNGFLDMLTMYHILIEISEAD